MANIRPEVLALARAAQELSSTEAHLTDVEIDKIVKCMAKLESYLQDGDGYDGHIEGDGHFDGDGHS